MKKKIWIALILGGALGSLDFISIAVDFLIPLGPFGATGPQEILTTMSAALGGPLGALVTSALQELGVFLFFLRGEFPPGEIYSRGVLFSTADLVAHLLGCLVVAFGYRILYQRAKKAIVFFAGWILLVIIYYTVLVPMQSLLLGLVVPVTSPLIVLFRNNLPEFLVVTTVSTLIWVALPKRFHRPRWYEVEPVDTSTKDGIVYKGTGI